MTAPSSASAHCPGCGRRVRAAFLRVEGAAPTRLCAACRALFRWRLTAPPAAPFHLTLDDPPGSDPSGGTP